MISLHCLLNQESFSVQFLHCDTVNSGVLNRVFCTEYLKCNTFFFFNTGSHSSLLSLFVFNTCNYLVSYEDPVPVYFRMHCSFCILIDILMYFRTKHCFSFTLYTEHLQSHFSSSKLTTLFFFMVLPAHKLTLHVY